MLYCKVDSQQMSNSVTWCRMLSGVAYR